MPDLTAPVHRVSVLDQAGNEELLSPDSVRIINMTYTDSERGADKVVLTVDNYDLSNFDDPIWKQGNRLRVSWGYAGLMAPERECVIRTVTGFTRLKVEARGLAVVMNRVTRSRTFENATRAQVVRQVARENGYGDDAVDIDDTEATFEHLVQANETDAQFLRRLAHQEGFAFFVDHDGFHFHERRLDQRPARVITWFPAQDRQAEAEVVSVTIKTDVTALPGRVRVSRRDPVNREDVSATADNSTDTDRPSTGTRMLVADPETMSTSDQVLTSSQETTSGASSTPEAAAAEARARFRRAQRRAVKASITMKGDPNILAKSVVDFRGVGTRLSGNYYVKEAVHTIGPGYTLKLELVKDATGAFARRAARAGEGLPEVASARSTGRTAQATAGQEGQSQRSRDHEVEPILRVDPETQERRTSFVARRGRDSRTRGGRPAPPASTEAARQGREGS